MNGFLRKLRDGYSMKALGQAKRYVVAVVGFTVLLIGVALLVLPGPALIVIPLGLAILGTEFLWARRLLGHAKNAFQSTRSRFTRKGAGTDATGPRPMGEEQPAVTRESPR